MEDVKPGENYSRRSFKKVFFALGKTDRGKNFFLGIRSSKKIIF